MGSKWESTRRHPVRARPRAEPSRTCWVLKPPRAAATPSRDQPLTPETPQLLPVRCPKNKIDSEYSGEISPQVNYFIFAAVS